MKRILETFGEQETRDFGRSLGESAVPGQVICLDGDLGVGKTVLAQGFAEGLGISGPVASPTFTIVQSYQKGRLPFYHMDVYRLEDEDELSSAPASEPDLAPEPHDHAKTTAIVAILNDNSFFIIIIIHV